jgi:hypothetical protein
MQKGPEFSDNPMMTIVTRNRARRGNGWDVEKEELLIGIVVE